MVLTIIILSVVIVMLIGVLIVGKMFYSDLIAGFEWEAEEYKKKLEVYKTERNTHITRRVDLECALLWWVNECMKDYSDKQYGKGKLKELIEKDKLINISKVSK